MAALFPFAALRPAPGAAAAVAAVPYDVVSADEARALAAGNPLSFLHVSRAEIDLPPGTDPHSDAVYEKAAENFAALRDRVPFSVEERPCLYVYRLRMEAHVQTGVAACFSIDEYESGVIKKHETTRADKEDDRTRHLLALGAQTGPVLLTYRHSAAVDAIVSSVVAAPPLFDFRAADGVGHQVWIAPAAAEAALVSAFAAVPALYIADGHHRAASAARARRALDGRGAGEHDRLLAVAFPDDQMQVLPYNRVVRDLNGLTPETFLGALAARMPVGARAARPALQKGEVGVYVAGGWHVLTLPREGAGSDPAARLDVSVLQRQVLDPVLGIRDPRTDTRIDFVGGIRGVAELERLVDAGAYAAAFALHPVAVDDLMCIADAGGIMPPKSTWFEPKLRDGLLVHLI